MRKKKTQNRTPFRLAHGLSLFEPLTPHRRGLRRQSFGLVPGLSHFVPRTTRSDQSLSLAGSRAAAAAALWSLN